MCIEAGSAGEWEEAAGPGWQGAGNWVGARETVFRTRRAGQGWSYGREADGGTVHEELSCFPPIFSPRLSLILQPAIPPSTVCPCCSLLSECLSLPFSPGSCLLIAGFSEERVLTKEALPGPLFSLHACEWYSQPGTQFGGCTCESVCD